MTRTADTPLRARRPMRAMKGVMGSLSLATSACGQGFLDF